MPSRRSTSRDTVNVVSMNGYVKGVVPYEMPALWKPEAVRAQAVAARTYASWSRAQNPDRYYQICDTTSCQVYRGVNGEHPASNKATTATGRKILTYDGEPAFSQFSASSGGWTVAGSVPYLRAKKDPYDDWAGNSNHDWSVTLTPGRSSGPTPRSASSAGSGSPSATATGSGRAVSCRWSRRSSQRRPDQRRRLPVEVRAQVELVQLLSDRHR